MHDACSRARSLAAVLLCAFTLAARAETPSEDDLRWRARTGYNPQVHAAVEKSSDAEVFARVPYAYYPASNELEVVFDAAAASRLLPAGAAAPTGALTRVQVTVRPVLIPAERLAAWPFYYAPNPPATATATPGVVAGTVPLDAQGRGHDVLKLPALAVGNYQVEYTFGGVTLVASKTFRHTHFEWEGCTYGTEHQVYAPFTPVQVAGRQVSVVGRSYTLNEQGVFDSVVARGHELLAEPMRLYAELPDGRQMPWPVSAPGAVSGRATYPDLAEFSASTSGELGTLQAQTRIEEDGCARVQWTFQPAAVPATVNRLWLEIALKESEAPLCHLVGMNSMRHNYAGNVPRGGTITWIEQPWRPARFTVTPFAGEPPASYQVWEARQQMHWGSERWDFAPYVWLGAEERGLAWFGDDVQGYAPDGKSSLQRLLIAPGKVILRIDLIQQPTRLDTARTLVFGLQASPTKPLPADWRAHEVPGGGGMPVVVWGGFNCADKVPVNKDWTLVDKIMEGRRTRQADYPWFAEYARTHQTLAGGGGAKAGAPIRFVPLTEAKANDQPWLTIVNHFAGREAGMPPGVGTTVYFEEHQTNGWYPEVAEYLDEWGDTSFSRYRYFDHPLTWGPEIRTANAASYRDFAVFYANEWMKRGVGIYYDNTYPMVDYNRQRLAARGLTWSGSIWGHRDYYRRVWKRSRELMALGQAPLPLQIVGHITNCQVLPYTTWWDASLGVESPGHWLLADPPAAAAQQQALDRWGFVIMPTPRTDTPGEALPYPPDYLRAMEGGRMAGLVPHYRHLLRGQDAFGGIGIGFGATDQGRDAAVLDHRYLSDAAMGLVHEMRGGASGYDHPAVGSLRRALAEFGYGSPAVKVGNYWDEAPPITVGNPAVKWLALTREAAPMGLVLLQSYAAKPTTTTVQVPGAALLVDAATRTSYPVAANGTVTVALDADYGTRLLYALRSATAPTLLPNGPDTVLVDDFELGLSYNLGVKGAGFAVVPDTAGPDNHVLRLTPAHPAHDVLRPRLVTIPADLELSWRFRIPALPKAAGSFKLLSLGYRDADGQRYGLSLVCQVPKDGAASWRVDAPLLTHDGGKNDGYQTVKTTAAAAAPVDTQWHTLTLRTRGPAHELLIDGTAVFTGADDRLMAGTFILSCGWQLGESGIPFIELDDLHVRQLPAP